MKKTIALTGMLAALACALPAQAQFAKPEDAIKYRKAGFTLMAAHFGRLGAMAQGRVPFDAKAAAENADVLATVASDTLNANYSVESLAEGVVLLATREDDGTFAVRKVLQNQSVINSALATFASVGAEQEKARQLQEEQKAVDEQRAAARAALKVA